MGFGGSGSGSSIGGSSDAAISNPTNAQVLTYDSGLAKWRNQAAASTATNATSSSPGLVQLAGDLRGTATAPTVPALTSKVDTSRQVVAGTGLNGGGDLSANRTLSVAYGTTSTTVTAGNDARFTTVTATVQTASYTLALADAGTTVEMNAAAAVTVTIPNDSSVNFSAGSVVEIFQYGVGQVTFSAAGGVSLRSSSSYTARTQYSAVSLRKRAANEWILQGDLT